MIKFLKSKLTSVEISAFFILCDKSFIPPLSNRVVIEEYAEKLSILSSHFCIYYNKTLIGLSCCYCNDYIGKKAYISVTCIHPKFQGKGLGKKLTLFVEDDIKKMDFKKIRFEVDMANLPSLSMHEKIGYLIVARNEHSFFLEKVLNDE